MVALEGKHHKRCYEKYTSFLRHSMQSTGEKNKKQRYKYEKSFDVFCKDFVIERLIKQDNIYYRRKLKKEFIKKVQRFENEDASGYRSFRLRRGMRERFSQLMFHRPKMRSKSEIVYTSAPVQQLQQKVSLTMTEKPLRVHKIQIRLLKLILKDMETSVIREHH